MPNEISFTKMSIERMRKNKGWTVPELILFFDEWTTKAWHKLEEEDKEGKLGNVFKKSIIVRLKDIPHKYAYKDNPLVERICLKCNQKFKTKSNNRLCKNCHSTNKMYEHGVCS